MGRSRVLQEVLVMRFEEIYGRFSEGRLNCEEASDLLGISLSSFRRRRRRFTRFHQLIDVGRAHRVIEPQPLQDLSASR